MPFTGRALGALVMGFLLAAGCGGSTEEGGPGGTGGAPSVGPVSQQDFARVFASSACSSMASCCQANKFAYDYQVCKSSLEGQLQASLFRIQGLAVGYDAAAAGQCTGGVIEVLSACKGDAFASDSCDRIFVGTLPAGAQCTDSQECAEKPGESAYCDLGVCSVSTSFSADPVHAQAGGPCGATCTPDRYSSYDCSSYSGAAACYTDDGLVCDPATRTCKALPTLGQPCTSYCDASTFCELGVCVGRRASGPCTTTQACTSTAYCDFARGQCSPRKPDGAFCEFSDECLVDNCRGGVCGPDIPVDAGFCVGLLN